MLNGLLSSEVFETDLHSSLRNPDASFLLALWRMARGSGDIPSEAQMPAMELERLKPQLMMLRPAGRGDWSYAWYGAEIAKHAGFDMTGRCVSEFQGDLGAFFRRLYQQVTDERRPLASIHRFGPQRSKPLWERLILPVAGAEATVLLYVVNRVRAPALEGCPADQAKAITP